MEIEEAREIVSKWRKYTLDDPKFIGDYSDHHFLLAKGVISGWEQGRKDGWESAVKKCAEMAIFQFRCMDPGHDVRYCATCEAGNDRAALIEDEILKLSKEGSESGK